LVLCANTNVETVFEFVIDSPLPLTANGPQNIDATCGDVNILDPQITGGVHYYAFQWSTGETTPTIQVSPEVTTTYTYTVTDGCSVDPISGSITVTLPVYQPLEITVTGDIEIPCLESEPISVTSVTGGNGAYTYSWTKGTTVVGNTSSVTVPAGEPLYYVVTVSEGCGDMVQDSVMVSTAPLDPISITTTGDVTVICLGDTAVLGVVGITGGNGVYSLEWAGSNGTPLSEGHELEVTVPADATYTITVEDQCGYSGDEQVRTLVPHYDRFQLASTPDHVVCFGDSTTVAVEVSGGSGYYTIEWIDRGWTDPILKVYPLATDDYVVKVADRCGEELMESVEVEVETLFMNIVEENLGQDDWHVKAATVPPAFIYKWDMGDGTHYRTNEAYHSYLDLEDHWVTLTVTTANGCSGTDSIALKVPAHIYFPTAFSPDGDGINETFGPVGNYIEEFEMTIFDRWGEAIYSTANTAFPWTGDVNGGDAANTGVYVYHYKARGHYFPATQGFGSVTLLKGTEE
jgi:gliding motility-associated-like protein